MPRFLAFATLVFVFATALHADFAAGMRAYQNGDFGTAMLELKREAEAGNASAQFTLGFMYSAGKGTAVNEAEALKWYRMAAQRGNADAQYAAGYMLLNGKGAAADEAEAARMFQLAGRQQHLPA